MAAIIRAAALSADSRRLRRPGAAGLAAPAAMASAAQAVEAVAPAPPVAMDTPQLLQYGTALQAPQDAAPQPQPLQQLRDELAATQAQLAQQLQRSMRQQEQLGAQEEQLGAQQEQLAQLTEQLQAAQQQLNDEAAGIKRDAEQNGYREGREQGEGEARATAALQLERLQSVLQALTQSKRKLLAEHEDMLVEIAFAATCRMLGAGAASRAGLASIVGSLVEAAREPELLCVRLHPQDLAQLADGAPGLDARLQFQADAGIEIGGCVIDSPRGTLDARLELQLQHLREALLQVRKARNNDEAPI